MIVPTFILAFVATIGFYLVVSGWFDRRVRLAAVRRFGDKDAVLPSARRSVQPVLMQITDAVRGRVAIRILERLQLKQSAEGWLETAALKWGAAGLLHRSVGAFLAAFAVVTFFTA